MVDNMWIFSDDGRASFLSYLRNYSAQYLLTLIMFFSINESEWYFDRSQTIHAWLLIAAFILAIIFVLFYTYANFREFFSPQFFAHAFSNVTEYENSLPKQNFLYRKTKKYIFLIKNVNLRMFEYWALQFSSLFLMCTTLYYADLMIRVIRQS